MLQDYGINIWGDLAGLAVTAMIVIGIRSMSIKASYAVMHVCFIISAVGSISLLPAAAGAGHMGVFAYHVAWVMLGVVGLIGLWHLFLKKPKTHGAPDPFLDGSAYNITSLP